MKAERLDHPHKPDDEDGEERDPPSPAAGPGGAEGVLRTAGVQAQPGQRPAARVDGEELENRVAGRARPGRVEPGERDYRQRRKGHPEERGLLTGRSRA